MIPPSLEALLKFSFNEKHAFKRELWGQFARVLYGCPYRRIPSEKQLSFSPRNPLSGQLREGRAPGRFFEKGTCGPGENGVE